jgi:4-amino-4-deoxy-L-arabinose transferase-like glycosyltransferase
MTTWQRAALLFVFAFAAAVRLDGLAELPLSFAPARQYYSALRARSLYYETQDQTPEWRKEVARHAVDGRLEPPFMELLAVAGYLLAGGERLWIPRLLSALFWLAGGGFLFLVARWIGGFVPALAGTAFYLLLPFSVPASESFQPNPLMVMLTTIALWNSVRYRLSRQNRHFLAAAVAAGLGILVMPVCAPVILGALAALHIEQHGWRKLPQPSSGLFLLIALVPGAAYYGYGVLAGDMGWKVPSSFVPEYFLNVRFWNGTLKRVRIVMGFSFPLIGVLGTFLATAGPKRALLFGLWSGYAAMCFLFNYHVSTHDYYHLLLIPIVALSLVPLIELVLQRLNEMADGHILRKAAYGLLALAVFLGGGTAYQARRKPQVDKVDAAKAALVGRAVEHTTRAIVLDPFDRAPLFYHGFFAGLRWPHLYDIRDEAMWGWEQVPARERLESYSRRLGVAQYFVVTDEPELNQQPELKRILESESRLVASGEGYAVFKLSGALTETANGQ